MVSTLERIRPLLTPREKRRYLWLVGAYIGIALLEVGGVVSVLPFMELVADPGAADRLPLLGWIRDQLGLANRNSFLFATGVGMLVLLTLATAARAGGEWLKLRVTWETVRGVSTRLQRRFLRQPYPFFLRQHSSDLGKQVTSEVDRLVTGGLTPLTDLATHTVVGGALLGLMFFMNGTLAAVLLLVVGGVYAVSYVAIQRYLRRIGHVRYWTNQRRIRAAWGGFQNIRTVKLTGTEDFFSSTFERETDRLSELEPKQQILSRLPRFVLDVVAFGGVLVVLLYLIRTEGGIQEMLPAFSLFVVSAYRLIPSLQTIYGAANELRYNQPAIEELAKDVTERTADRTRREATEARELELDDRLRVDGVTFRYQGGEAPAVRDVNLTIRRSEAVALVGATGSGKTTLADLVAGLLRPDEGEIRVDGTPLTDELLPGWRRTMGYVPQEVSLYDATVARNIAFGLPDDRIDRDRVRRAARIAELHHFIEGLPEGYETRVGEGGVRLSGGQKQRIVLARVVYRAPSLLILDEATSALDALTEEEIFEAIRRMEREVTSMMIAHRLASVRHVDRIYLMERGRIVDHGTYGELAERSETFRRMARITEGQPG